MHIISITDRKEREKAAMREGILNAARKIVADNGVEEVSIRKIAGIIEYSPASIYHYFKSKEEIIEILLEESYRKIIETLTSINTGVETPEEALKERSKRFITMAVQMGDVYKSIMLNASATVLAHTSVLQRGASCDRTAIGILCDILQKLPGYEEKTKIQLEMTAQVIWALAFGLSLRLIVEQVEEEQRQLLIEHTADFVLSALKNGIE